MVEYKCDRCNKLFNKKPNYTVHINRKFPCKRVIGRVGLKNNQKQSKTIIQQSQTITNQSQKIKPSNEASKNNLNCAYCNKDFSHPNNLHRHIKTYCKIKKEEDNEKEDNNKKQQFLSILIKQVDELKEKITTLEKNGTTNIATNSNNNKTNNKTINNINNINNGSINNNNFQLVAFGKETLDKITKQDLTSALKKGFMSVVELAKKIHFNPNIPENQNIYIPSIKDTNAMVYNGKKWNAYPAESVIDDLYDNKKAILIGCMEELGLNLNDNEQRCAERWKDTPDDHKRIKNVKKETRLLLFNERNVPLDMIKSQKKKTLTQNMDC
jgi:uncharacterized C2H2 Zn-finger protein